VPDPRVFYAAERTLLAWIRSGLTVMALGFVVARFGLFLTLISGPTASTPGAHHNHWLSNTVGIGLLVLGAGVILGALRNHQLFVRSLAPEDVPALPMPWLTSLLAVALSAIGLVLAVYLVVA
jgi:inner membrane protein YidH